MQMWAVGPFKPALAWAGIAAHRPSAFPTWLAPFVNPFVLCFPGFSCHDAAV